MEDTNLQRFQFPTVSGCSGIDITKSKLLLSWEVKVAKHPIFSTHFTSHFFAVSAAKGSHRAVHGVLILELHCRSGDPGPEELTGQLMSILFDSQTQRPGHGMNPPQVSWDSCVIPKPTRVLWKAVVAAIDLQESVGRRPLSSSDVIFSMLAVFLTCAK